MCKNLKYLEICGHLMNKIPNIKLDGVDVHFGVITDGVRKIKFHLFAISNIPDIEVGTKIQLSGD